MPDSIGQLKNLEVAWIENTSLSSIPDSIGELSRLRALLIQRNLLTQLPESIGQLYQLKMLDVASNGLTSLPESIGQLVQLTFLKVSSQNKWCEVKPLTKLPSSIGKLRKLRELFVDDNGLTQLPASTSQLEQLEEFNLSGNKFTELPNSICQLTQLKELDFSRNEITKLPSSIGDLKHLKKLRLWRNKLTTLPYSIGKLEHLNNLDIAENELSKLPNFFGELGQLRELNVSCNKLKDMPESIVLLEVIETLHLRNNCFEYSFLSKLRKIIELNCLKILTVKGNPALGIPKDITNTNFMGNGGVELVNIKAYFGDLEISGGHENRKVKLMFVGNGRVGKTSLAYCLKHKEKPPEDMPSTHGIIIDKIQLPDEEGNEFLIYYQDFGGQEIYHATNRLFFSDNALYLVLWALETDESQDEFSHELSYWLHMIDSLSSNCQIAVIENQIDRNNNEVSIPNFPKNFRDEQVVSISISAKENYKINWVRAAISTMLTEFNKSPVFVPNSWLEVSKWLGDKTAKTIPYQYFVNKCLELTIHNYEVLIKYLEDTGECILLREANTIVLDPNWAITAVYTLFDKNEGINSPRRRLMSMKGEAPIYQIWEYLDAYTSEEQIMFLNYMLKTNICFLHPTAQRFERTHEDILVFPSLMSKEPERFAYLTGSTLKYQLTLPAYHRLLIEGFIRKTSHLSPKFSWWFNGIEITVTELNTTATIVACPEAATVTIYISGSSELTLLKRVLKTLYTSEFFVPQKEYLCLPEYSNDWVDVKTIEAEHKAGNKHILSVDDTALECSKYFQALALDYKNAETLEQEPLQRSVIKPDIRFKYKQSVMIISAFLFDVDIFALTKKPSKNQTSKAHGYLLNIKNSTDDELGHSKNTTSDVNWKKWLQLCMTEPNMIQGAAFERFSLHLCGFITGLLKEMQSDSGVYIDRIPVTIHQLTMLQESNPQLSEQLNTLLLYTANQIISDPESVYKTIFKARNFNGHPPVNVVSNYLEQLSISAEDSNRLGIPIDYLDEVLAFKSKGRAESALPN